MKKRTIHYAVAAAFVAASALSNVAHAVVELESNDSLGTAQQLTIVNGGAEVTGAVGVTTTSVAVTPDVDFYSFVATAGDVLTIDINGGIKDGGPMSPIRSVDTILGVFSRDGALLYVNDDAEDLDAGSLATNDSRIVNAVLPATGTYIVGVSSTSAMSPRTFVDGGMLSSATVDSRVGNGSYTLTISGATTPPPPQEEPPVVTPPPGQAQPVNIDIRPRHAGVARIYPNADGNITVAVHSSASFDALKVDRASLTFGSTGDEASLSRCWHEGLDVNRDGRKDLICRFNIKMADFEVGDLEGVLKGTVQGQKFEGHAPLKVVQHGKKRKQLHHRHYRDYDDRGHDRDGRHGHDDDRRRDRRG
jgi:pre-peptidase